MQVLNENEAFGVIAGHYEEVPAARYTQAGRFYDAAKQLIQTEAERLAAIAAQERADAEAAKVAEETRIASEEAERLAAVPPNTATVEDPAAGDISAAPAAAGPAPKAATKRK